MNLYFLQFALHCVAIVVTACVANYWLSIIVIIIFILLLFLRNYFLYSSRNVQRLEALGKYRTILELMLFNSYTARSPIYSHISSTIQGLSTIRAYREQIGFLNNLHFYQNEHTKGWYTKVATNRWFGIRLDMFGAVFITFLVLTSIPLSDGNNSYMYMCVIVIIVVISHLLFSFRPSPYRIVISIWCFFDGYTSVCSAS